VVIRSAGCLGSGFSDLGFSPIRHPLIFCQIGKSSTTNGKQSIASQPILRQCTTMPSITLSQLRNTRLLLDLLKAGETIELRERKRVIAYITPVQPWPFPDEDAKPKKAGKK